MKELNQGEDHGQVDKLANGLASRVEEVLRQSA